MTRDAHDTHSAFLSPTGAEVPEDTASPSAFPGRLASPQSAQAPGISAQRTPAEQAAVRWRRRPRLLPPGGRKARAAAPLSGPGRVGRSREKEGGGLRARTCVAGPSSRLILIFKKQNPHNKQTVHKYSLNVLLPRVLCASQIHILFQLLKFFLS